MPVDPDIKKRLRDELDRRDISFENADALSGLKAGYVRNALNRDRGKIESLILVAKALGRSRAWLFGEEASADPVGDDLVKAGLPRFLENAVGQNAGALIAAPVYGSPIQVLGVSRGGEDGRLIFNGEVIETIPRPPELEGVENAYGAYVIGESMWPRFHEGDRVWVHPRRPAQKGHDVIVQLFAEQEGEPPEGYIKQFVSFTGSELILAQYNPAKEIRYPRGKVKSVHVIVGALYR